MRFQNKQCQEYQTSIINFFYTILVLLDLLLFASTQQSMLLFYFWEDCQICSCLSLIWIAYPIKWISYPDRQRQRKLYHTLLILISWIVLAFRKHFSIAQDLSRIMPSKNESITSSSREHHTHVVTPLCAVVVCHILMWQNMNLYIQML